MENLPGRQVIFSLCPVSLYFVSCVPVLCVLCPCTLCPVSLYFVSCVLILCVLCPCTLCPVSLYFVSCVPILWVLCPYTLCPVSLYFVSCVPVLCVLCPYTLCPVSLYFVSCVPILGSCVPILWVLCPYTLGPVSLYFVSCVPIPKELGCKLRRAAIIQLSDIINTFTHPEITVEWRIRSVGGLFNSEVRFQSQFSPSGNYSGPSGHWARFDICGSMHHSVIHKENPTRCNSISKFYLIFM